VQGASARGLFAALVVAAPARAGLGDALPAPFTRILSTTSSGLVCNAFVTDAVNNPPSRMMPLPITGPKKQKGQ
jgi:hypothetical protein